MIRILSILLTTVALGCGRTEPSLTPAATAAVTTETAPMSDATPTAAENGGITPVRHTPAEWRKLLTRDQYRILREAGTELAFTGALLRNHEAGIYRCAGCNLELYRSDTKFESGTGWPSFYQPIAANHIHVGADDTHGMSRDEVRCARCEGHLGHVFNDGPEPTGLRYCMNSAALTFEKQAK